MGARSSRRICGTSCAGRRTKSSCGYRRMARPGPVRPARPARWLALGLADARHLKRRQAGPGRVAGHARQAAIDHRADAIDGDGTFRHVGGEDDLGLGAGGDGAVLLFGRLIAVEGQELPPVTAGQGRAGGLRAADFERPGQEDQDMSARARGRRGVRARRPPGLPAARRNAACTRFRAGADVLPTEARAGGAAAPRYSRDRRGVQGGGHDDDLEIGPPRALQAPQQGQREIAFEMALVEFVEHHAAHARQIGVAQHAAREHALGQEAQARAGSRHFFEAHLIADCLADGLTALGCHITRRQTRGQTARFQHEHLAAE